MNSSLSKRLAKLELTQPPGTGQLLIVGLPTQVPVGYSGKVIITGVPRPCDAPEAA